MSPGEEHDGGERKEEQKGSGEASWLKEDYGGVEQRGDASSAVQQQDKLGEGWPQIELDRDKKLVVCTIDTQLLSGGFHLLMGSCGSEKGFSAEHAQIYAWGISSSAWVSSLVTDVNFLLCMVRRKLLVVEWEQHAALGYYVTRQAHSHRSCFSFYHRMYVSQHSK